MFAAPDEPDGALCAGRTGRYCEHGQRSERTLTLQKNKNPRNRSSHFGNRWLMAPPFKLCLVLVAAHCLRASLAQSSNGINTSGSGGTWDGDGDGDGVPDSEDWCPHTPAELSPTDGLDISTGCSQWQLDVDLDGVCNPHLPILRGVTVDTPMCTGVDNCPFVPNPQQTDSFGDARGDACDPGASPTVTLLETPQPCTRAVHTC